MQGLASLGVGQWLGAAGLVAAPTLVAWLEGRRTAWPLGFATFFLLFGLAHLLLPGNIVALWAALMLTAIIGMVSKLKHRYLGFNFLAGDICHLAASSFRSVLADHARMTIPALAAMIAVVLGMMSWRGCSPNRRYRCRSALPCSARQPLSICASSGSAAARNGFAFTI